MTRSETVCNITQGKAAFHRSKIYYILSGVVYLSLAILAAWTAWLSSAMQNLHITVSRVRAPSQKGQATTTLSCRTLIPACIAEREEWHSTLYWNDKPSQNGSSELN